VRGGGVLRLKRVRGTPETVELGLRFFDEVVVGCCEAVPGFCGAWFLIDRENSRTITLSSWQDVEALEQAQRNLGAALERDPVRAATCALINACGSEFETYEVEASAGPADRR
jgi:hypothetical protein